ncbi:hypothetical protein M3181_05910 [Mesobacillus maritimus]|uniref:hypothetical protein n=1 Tax=Mesobacillus maritimus TaxID=1643336 RepID=UPI00203BBD62|nr:hypothetical protein [Mesobacillus maritimus]MCM3668535.1 hypothetical protein [Mesobacillus maritimus]
MNPIKGLIKKDFRITRNLFFTWAGAIILAMGAGVGLSAYTSQPAGTLPVIFLLGLAHIVFAPIMMFVTLNQEAKTQLWLYTPRRAVDLIVSKFTVIFTYQLIMQLLLSIYTAFNLFWFGRDVYEQIGPRLFGEAAIILNIALIVFGFYFTSCLTFLWTVYHSLKKRAKVLRWAAVLLLVFGYNLLEGLILSYDPLSELIFKYKVNVISNAALRYSEEKWSVMLEPAGIPVIPLLLYGLLIAVLLGLAAKLLDRKVEV